MKKKYVFLTKEINVFKYVTINDEIRKYILRCTSFNNNGCNNQFIKKLHFYHTYVPTFYSYLKKLEIKKKCHIYNENNNIVIYKRLICIHKNKKEYHVNINEVPINNEDGKDNKVNIKENNKMYRNSKDHIHKKKNHVKINYNKILIQTNEQHKKSKIEDKWNENSHVREDEIYLHVNNLCKKIYYLSKNKIKDENLWKHYLIQYYKENKNYDHIKIKNIFMLLLGITNSNKHIKDMIIVINDEEKINEKGKKKKNIKIIEIVYNHLDILSKKINQMTNNQLSIFLYILEKWNMIDNYKDITNEINFKILNQTSLKKVNIKCFLNVLYIYSKNYEQNVNKNNNNENKNNKNNNSNNNNNICKEQKCVITKDKIKIFINKFGKQKFRIEDILYLLSSMYKLKIKNKSILNNIIQYLNIQNVIKDSNYFLIPSLLLSLANLNIYDQQLYLNFKNVIMENYYFYNSIHFTNLFYSFAKFKPDYVQELFEKIATHIMMHTNNSSTDNNKSTPETQIILKGKEKEINNNPNLKNHKNNDFFENDDKYTINNKMVDQTNNNTFNIFQITNIINSCLKCNYVNYDFFSYLLKQGNLFMDNSEPLDNLINVLNCVSNILKHFNVFKYKLYFHYEKKEKNQWQQENWLVHNDLTCSGKNHENSRNKIANWQNKIEHNNLDNKNNNMDFNNMMTSPLYYYYYYYYDNDPSKGYCNLFEILYGYNSGYNLYTSFSSLSYVVKYNEQMFLKKFKDSKQSEVPHNFEIHLDNISDKILKIIEQNLNHENMKYIIHNLMISLSLCDIKYLNLYALCFFILKENYYYLSIDNLYLYLEILHRMKIYNHDIFYSIMEYINTHVHALESQKKMKIFLLSYNIFQKMDNPVDMKEMCDFFLSSNNKIEKENGNDDLMLGKCTHEKNLWKLPTDIEIKQNLINLENFQKELLSNNDNDKMEFHDNNCNIIGHDKFFSNNDENKIKKEKYFNLKNEIMVFKKIEKTETLPCTLNIYDYINFLLILIFYQCNNKIKECDEKINLNFLFSKDENVIITIQNEMYEKNNKIKNPCKYVKNKQYMLDKYSEMLKENLFNIESSLIQLFSIFVNLLEKGEDDKELFVNQIMFILDFIKIINEKVYINIMKIVKKMKNYDENIKRKNYFTTYSKNKYFQLKKIDLEYINSNINNKKKNTYNDFFFNENNINYRYQYQSVHKAIQLFSDNIIRYSHNEKINTHYKNNKYIIKDIKTFYKLDNFLISDILLILEKQNKEQIFYFLLFYPFELKQTVIHIKNNTFLFNYKYDETFLFNMEILFLYNFLKNKFSEKTCSFSIIDTTQFIDFSKNEYTNGHTNEFYEHLFNSIMDEEN
ncbi:hypothetical protein PFMG_02935 [Plasmodium falciparum IGH-CR14]|uniref:Uncharacterized protein n=6 Tax=Plasmodium falciparum TaxID=5833 RepID=O96187_PLAF7|nr:conserved Plasmodium protein, unknown function [Plasmodium falciparum 3D7]ETW57801.1 hypothetical protein PFUGPA_00251 [Plasmodium falciparum Palo Alto/Uganda]ETW63864.1 hypothetical protein PFMC_00244 [Plasmodium falciparum CAMP/Malaysia]EUR79135.1 hypothetical protein PFBG_00625 [Plasmodium falciparum 7G8]KAF4331475.1 hypothetical protein CYL21_0312 [Plasmodium falciparum NF54]KNG76904.1 hypothetical protein PFMG_02935 [Plasmodium falciparum IGH-CR14]|eukprot:XP_001349612.1 conserved Plasmodium protein, unknown function [Plasmodium falciparum 3D7]